MMDDGAGDVTRRVATSTRLGRAMTAVLLKLAKAALAASTDEDTF
jgi:hypothetical protein